MTGNFLVVIDGTPECESAVRYAARRSELAEKELFVIVAIDNQKETHWLGVERRIIEEAEQNTKLLKKIIHLFEWNDSILSSLSTYRYELILVNLELVQICPKLSRIDQDFVWCNNQTKHLN